MSTLHRWILVADAILLCFGLILVSHAYTIFANMGNDALIFDPDRAFFAMAILIVLGGILVTIVMINSKYRIKLIIAGLSLVFSLFLGEFYLYFIEANKTGEFGASLNILLDQVDALNKQGQDVKPAVYYDQSFYVLNKERELTHNSVKILPLGNISKAKILACKEDKYQIFNTDEHGFHNPLGSFKQHADVLILGDSFAEGHCVDEAKNTASILREKFPQLLNLGRAGTGPLTQAAILREYGIAQKPKIVLWFFYEGNDIKDLEIEKQSLVGNYLKPSYYLNLIDKQSEIDSYLTGFIGKQAEFLLKSKSSSDQAKPASKDELSIFSYEHLVRRLTNNTFFDKVDIYSRFLGTQEAKDVYGQLIHNANTLINQQGGKLILVYVPSMDRYVYSSPVAYLPMRRLRDGIFYFLQKEKIQLIDIRGSIDKTASPLDYFTLLPDGQYLNFNEKGYALMAQAILTQLENPQPIPYQEGI